MSKTESKVIAAYIANLFTQDPNRDFVYDSVTQRGYTYSDFWQQVEHWGNFLDSTFPKDVPIAIMLPNSLVLCSFYFAALLKERVVIPIDPLKGRQELLDILSIAGSPPLITPTGEAISGYSQQISSQPNFLDFKESSPAISQQAWQQINFHKLYIVTFTSGTTGQPKGVMHSFGNFFEASMAFANQADLNAGCVFYHNLPMTYMAGILNLIFMPFLIGAKIVLAERFSVTQSMNFWDLIISKQVNTFFFIPAIISLLLKFDRSGVGQEYCKQNSILALIGTAPLSKKLQVEFETHYQIPLYESYGLSETLFLATNSPDFDIKYGVGRLLPGVECKLSSDGEILAQCPWSFLGYYKQASFNQESFFLTGDLGEIDNDRSLLITGRKKDLIIRGGINISPKRIEQVLQKFDFLEEYVVVGIDDDFLGERTTLFYVANQKTPATYRKDLNQELRVTLGEAYLIDRFVGLENLPRNINGKIDTLALRKMPYDS